MSGNEDNEMQLKKMQERLKTLFIFHADISGKDNNDKQFLKMHPRLVTLSYLKKIEHQNLS